jgi:hypothetical protein
MTKERNWKLSQFLSDGKYLPKFMRDFHDQKRLFKLIHWLYDPDMSKQKEGIVPDWVKSQCYVIDWFLWFMASRGYTLQKNKTKTEFEPQTFSIEDWVKEFGDRESK